MSNLRWWKATGDALATGVARIADQLWRDQQPYRTRCLESLSLYEGRRLPALTADAYLRSGTLAGDEYDEYYWNVPRSLVNAVTAKIAGRQRPKPSLVCSDADWQTKRRAKKLERFCEAQLHQPQGPYRDAWQLATRVFLDAAVFGFGAIKIFADTEEKRVALERVLPWELLVDPVEANNGEPLNFFQRAHFDKDELAERFPDHADAIMSAKADDDREHWGTGQRLAQSVLVYEAWRLPIGQKPGLHVICINGTVLFRSEWKRREPPFVFLRWAPELLGFGGTSLVDEAKCIAEEVNYTVERMREGERLVTNAALIYEEGSVDDEALNSNEIGIKIPVKANATKMPIFVNPQGFSESTLSWLRLNYDKSFELTGVSQMSAGSRKEPGVTAGVALRTIANMETERFSVIFSAFEQMVAVDIPRHQIACTRELHAEHQDFAVSWPGSKFLQSFKWGEVSLEDDQYVMQPYAVAGIVNSPADRIQLAQDLYNSGNISNDAFLRVLQFKDTDGELERSNAQYSVVERYIESWLDATPESQEDGTFRYRAPIPFMDHVAALLQVARAFMVAELEGAPDFNLDFFLTFMRQCDEQIQKLEARRAQAAQGIPPGAGGAPAPMGAPPVPGAPAPTPMVN